MRVEAPSVNRVATRLLSLVFLTLVPAALASACASEESPTFNPNDAGAVCDPKWCPMGTGMSQPCCTPAGKCGFDFGTGCTAPGPDAGT